MTVYEYGDQAIPKRMRPALDLYVSKRKPVGHFLRAVLSNDFVGAVTSADEENGKNLRAYAIFLCNVEPATCHGSEEAYKAWTGDPKKEPKPVPEPDAVDDMETTFRITEEEWDKLVDATELIEYYIVRGPNALADRIVCIPPSKREEFTNAVLLLVKCVKEKVTMTDAD